MSEEKKACLPIDRELHPVGSRLLVTLARSWLVEGGEPELDEVTVVEWSPGGHVKLLFGDLGYDAGSGSWYRPGRVEVVERLETEEERYRVPKGVYHCRP